MAQVREPRSPGAPAADRTAPRRPALVLISLILVAAVANLNLAVANVALPGIGQAFDASQAALDLVAVAYSLGLAASVLYLGALVAPRSARLVETHGARFTLLLGYAACLLGFVTMLLLWTDHSSYVPVGLAYALIGVGVGLAGTPASRSLTGAVPVTRAGMASGTADLQRDLGGAVMQSVLGALLTAGYASAVAAAVAAAPNRSAVTSGVEAQLTRSFASAGAVADRYPQYADAIIAAARASFVDGADWAYLAGIAAILAGAALVWIAFPGKARERQLLARYQRLDAPPRDGGGARDVTRSG